MIELTEEYIKSTAFNDSAFANGKKLAGGNKIVNTYITSEKDLIFGECLGSGKSNYKTSVDFVNPNEPVFRCSCPSRQIPCKHATALLYYYFLHPEKFEVGEVPEDVASKREKIEKRAEKKKEEASKPKKVNVAAFVKKMKQQLLGIELVEKFIEECLSVGIASIPLTQINSYKKELVKELGNYYIPTYQAKVERILQTLEEAVREDEEYRKAYYGEALNELTVLKALISKGRQTLEASIEAKKAIDTESAEVFTKMGYIWKMEELKQLGFYKEEAELVQLGFYSYEDLEEKAQIDVGYYMDLEKEPIYKTLNIRPYKLLKRLKAEDTQFEKLKVDGYAIYPGELNKRIRFEGYQAESITTEVVAKIRQKAQSDFKEILKTIKNQLKNPLADRHPVMLVSYKQMLMCTNEENGKAQYILKDATGESILLENTKKAGTNDTLLSMKFMLQKEDLENQVMLGMFEYQEEDNKLIMQPISVITDSTIKRLLG